MADVIRLAETASRLVSELEFDRLSDHELAELRGGLERARRALDARMAVLVRDIVRGRRIGPSRRTGSGDVEAYVQAKTGLTKEQATKYIAVSAALDTAAGAAFLDGTISADAAYAIQRALPIGPSRSGELMG